MKRQTETNKLRNLIKSTRRISQHLNITAGQECAQITYTFLLFTEYIKKCYLQNVLLQRINRVCNPHTNALTNLRCDSCIGTRWQEITTCTKHSYLCHRDTTLVLDVRFTNGFEGLHQMQETKEMCQEEDSSQQLKKRHND